MIVRCVAWSTLCPVHRANGIRLLLALAGLAGLAGCHSAYPAQRDSYQTALGNGGYAAAAEVAAGAAESDPASGTLWSLELAAAQRAAGRVRECAEVLEAAEALFLEADAGPELSLSGEGLATLTDPYALPYAGRNLDRIFAATYQALAHLSLGEREKARVCLTRSLFRMEDSARRVVAIRSTVEREEKEISQQDTQMQARIGDSRLASVRAGVNARFAGREPRENALAPWLHGIFHLRTAEGPADLERARKSLRRAADMAAGDRFITTDLALAETSATRPDPGPGRTVVYLIHEEGLAPEWTEERVAIPLIYGDVRAPMVNLALPALVPRPRQTRPIQVAASGLPAITFDLLTDVDALVHAEFREAYPLARNRAIASATMKAVAGYAANKAAQESARQRGDSAGAQLLATATLMVTNAYALESAHADLRSWTSLPQTVHLARIEVAHGTPIRISGGSISGEVVHKPAPVRAVIVTIRSISPNTPVILQESILQP
ncbi:MAG: hypothetical protein ACO23N_01020 [Opitutales bacterium]